MQDCDGYSEQVTSLRDKVSHLARQLAETEDSSARAAQRVDALERELADAHDRHMDAEKRWLQGDEAHAARIGELEGAAELAERAAAAAARAARHEKLLLVQVRFADTVVGDNDTLVMGRDWAVVAAPRRA